MGVYETIVRRRTIRRFQDQRIPYEVLERCVNAARLAPSAANLQPCQYLVIDEESLLDKVFATLKWAGYITDGRPVESEVPRAYIVILVNRNICTEGYQHDVGFAVENITLTALEDGIGSCCFGSINRKALRENLNIPVRYIIDLIVALGYPKESPLKEPWRDSVKYWKDEKRVLHVPKRNLREILHRNTINK